ncbi:MAG: hypothetical protein NVSMB42_05670 [Herpetosiphon sp.]
MQRIRDVRYLVVVLLVVASLAIVILWVHQLPFPLSSDDVGDLANACLPITAKGLQYGPLYHAFYCGLKHILHDPGLTFVIKQGGLVLAIEMLAFTLLRAFGQTREVAGGIAAWLLLTLLTVNGTSEFTFALALFACIMAVRRGYVDWVPFLGIMCLAFFVRTEYILALGATTLLLAFRLMRKCTLIQEPGFRRSLVAAVVLTLICGSLLIMNPDPDNGPRAWLAFGQHFALNYQAAFHQAGDPWSEWQQFVHIAFPSSSSTLQAMRENPHMFAWHLTYNLYKRFPVAVGQLLVPKVFTYLLPTTVIQFIGTVILILATAEAFHTKFHDQRFLPLIGLLVVPSYSFVVMPEARHLLPCMPLLLVLVSARLRRCWQDNRRWMYSIPILGIIMLSFGLGKTLVIQAVAPPPTAQSVLTSIAAIHNTASATHPIRLLTSWYGPRTCRLASTPFCVPLTFSDHLAPYESISSYAQAQQANWILVGPEWNELTAVLSDRGILALWKQPTAFGCNADPISREGYQLIRCPAFRESVQ